MERDTILIGHPGGIPVRLHATWFLVAALIAWSLAGSYFPRSVSGYSTGQYWVAAIIATLLFFASLLAHELAHSLVARKLGLKVREITLYLFGGVSVIESEAEQPRDEIWITIVGPITSIALGIGFGILWYVTGNAALISSMFGYLAVINLFLALFNLLPGFPLDGGRLRRALVWWKSGDPAHATRVAAGVGVGLGYLIVAVGIVEAFAGYWVNGLWLLFLGWYLQSMAQQQRHLVPGKSPFADLKVGDLTDPQPITVGPDQPLDQVVHDVMLQHGARVIPVISDDRFLGMLTVQRIGAIPRQRWPYMTAADAMIPARMVETAAPTDSADDAIARLRDRDLNQLAVVDDGRFVGLFSRGTILRQMEIRAHLHEK